jgi:predicted 2-oxoglutarate/Fe(II)-dependent dioxygenase YbiX
MIKTIKLSDKYNIYHAVDDNFKNIKEECIKMAKLNDQLVVHSNVNRRNNSIWFEINAKCFLEINKKVKSYIEEISGRKFKTYAEHFWIYTQTKGFNMEWMHQHLYVHPNGRSNIKTDYTFTYYLQIPKDLTQNEGNIVFETEDKVRHNFVPTEGDIFIFPADIRHTAIPTPNSDIDRLVYAGNLCLDVENQINYQKNIL